MNTVLTAKTNTPGNLARATGDEPLYLLLHSAGADPPVVLPLDIALDDAAPGPKAGVLSDAAVETNR